MKQRIARSILTTAAALPLAATVTTLSASAATTSSHVYKGASISTNWGTVQTIITVKGKRITSVKVVDPTHTARSLILSSRAVPVLISETLSAQSARIDTVSGATTISQAYITSLESALSKARL
jgi:uncharacterized protein with FMN-binding domain